MAEYRVLICGSRTWDLVAPIKDLLSMLKSEYGSELSVYHGAARGADSIAGHTCDALNIKYKAFPAQWDIHGRAAGPIRNRQMLDDFKPNAVHAFSLDISRSKGTANMVEQAKRRGIQTTIHNG